MNSRPAFLASLLFLFSALPAWAESGTSIEVPTVIIGDQEGVQSPVDPFSVFKAERVAPRKRSEPQRQTLADLLRDQVGVETQTYCANCGAKRLTINGLKGEHTSLLIDGLPLHSAISSFYGIDNVPVNGIADVFVMRGAGASLTNPEAIGGTINIITVDPLTAENSYSTSLGWDDNWQGKSQNHSLLYNLRSEDSRLGLSAGAQWSDNQSWDTDRNNVTESPQRQNLSALLKGRWVLDSANEVSARYSHAQLEILGGHSPVIRPTRVRPVAAQELDFVDGSVQRPYIGDPLRIMDWIKLGRDEAALTSRHQLSDVLLLENKVGYARQEQKSIYQHGFDYANIDNLWVGDSSLRWILSETQTLTFGLFVKDQRLRSASSVLFDDQGLPKDHFNASSRAAYLQFSQILFDSVEIDLALRADQVAIEWLDLDNQIEQSILAPRLQVLHEVTEHLSQRFSYGLGYRTPLTYFESQHGNNERGYRIDLTAMEKAHSLVYSLSYNTPDYYLTGGAHYTQLEGMAYGESTPSAPVVYRNTDEVYDILVTDLLVGFKPVSWWLVEASLEFFNYQDGYTRKLPTAAIERRTQLTSSIDWGPWRHQLTAQLIGSRDLSRYANYNNHFINRNQGLEPDLDPSLQRKRQKAPSFWTLDTSLSYQFARELMLSGGVTNLFNFTQAGVGDNPSAWHWHFNHAHFDGLHTWGPNIGRQYFLQVSGQF